MHKKNNVIYSADLKWWTCIRNDNGTINNDVKQELQPVIDDINTFKPEVPIRGKNFKSVFSYNEEDDILNVSILIDPYSIYTQEIVEDKRYLDSLDLIIEGRLKDLCFVLNIAYPGVFHILRSCIFRDNLLITKDFYFASDILTIDEDKYGWPKIEWLSVTKCWEWVVAKTNFLSDTSHTKVDIALHSLSYISEANDDTFIFYAILGLEALYNEESNKEDSILEQLRNKTKAILGEYPQNKEKAIKKALNDMYRKRSMLLHGSSTIKKCWMSFDSPDEDFEKFIKNLSPIYFATLVLLATIQKLITAGATEIKQDKHIKLI